MKISKQTNEHILFNLEEYMFTSKNIAQLVNINKSNLSMKKLELFQQKKDETIYTLTNKDCFFWALYILIHGFETYEILNKHDYFKIEKKEKIEYIEKLRTIKSILKEKKMRRNLIESDLMSEQISLVSVEALCVMNNISILYIKNKTFYEINKGEKFAGILKYNIDSNNVSIKHTYPASYKDFIRHNYYEIENISKPIKAISSYSLDEIHLISTKLEIVIKENGKKKTKQQLYNEIKSVLNF